LIIGPADQLTVDLNAIPGADPAPKLGLLTVHPDPTFCNPGFELSAGSEPSPGEDLLQLLRP
jgi:hypothetical protein